jgi:hypothetical protein
MQLPGAPPRPAHHSPARLACRERPPAFPRRYCRVAHACRAGGRRCPPAPGADLAPRRSYPTPMSSASPTASARAAGAAGRRFSRARAVPGVFHLLRRLRWTPQVDRGRIPRRRRQRRAVLGPRWDGHDPRRRPVAGRRLVAPAPPPARAAAPTRRRVPAPAPGLRGPRRSAPVVAGAAFRRTRPLRPVCCLLLRRLNACVALPQGQQPRAGARLRRPLRQRHDRARPRHGTPAPPRTSRSPPRATEHAS